MNTENEAQPESATEAAVGGIPLAQAIGTRNLLIVIITMPLVFLIVVMATISILGRPGGDKDIQSADGGAALSSYEALDILDQPSAGLQGVTAPTSASTLSINPSPLVIPEDAKISTLALDGDKLVVRIDDKDGGEIVIYDLSRGAAVQRIRVLTQMTVDGDDL